LGIGDADTAGVAGGMTKPTRAVTIPAGETVTPAAIPTDRAPAVGPFRLPAMNGRIRPRMSSPTAPMGGANMLGRRPDDEDVYG
jgi:hypothetical protein